MHKFEDFRGCEVLCKSLDQPGQIADNTKVNFELKFAPLALSTP